MRSDFFFIDSIENGEYSFSPGSYNIYVLTSIPLYVCGGYSSVG